MGNKNDDPEDPWGSNKFNDPVPEQTWSEDNDPFATTGGAEPSFNSEGFAEESDADNLDGLDGEEGLGAKKKQGGEDKRAQISGTAYCTILGLGNFIQGGIVGGAVGTVHAVVDGFTTGLRNEPGFGRYVLQAGGSSAVSFGVWLGSYSATKCTLRISRGKNDLFNSFGAGSIAGMISSLRTRNPRIIVVSGVASGILMTALDAFGGHSSSSSPKSIT